MVHLPGMDDVPSSRFTDWTFLFEKLNISTDAVNTENELSWREEERRSNKPKVQSTSNAELTYEQRAAKRKAEREERLKEKEAESP